MGILVFAIPSGYFCKKKVSRVKFYKIKQKYEELKAYSSLPGQFSSKRTQKARVQGNTPTNDEDQPVRRNRQL